MYSILPFLHYLVVAAVLYAFEEDGIFARGSLDRYFEMAGDEDAAVDRGVNIRSAK